MSGAGRRATRAGALLAGAAALAIALWPAPRRPSDAKTHEPATRSRDVDRGRPPQGDAPAVRDEPPARPSRPTRRAASGPAPALRPDRLLTRAARDYRDRARYPRNAHPLEPGDADPVLRGRRATERAANAYAGDDPRRLVVWAAKPAFAHPEPVVVHARLEERGGITSRGVRVAGTVRARRGGAIGTLRFVDDGTAGDAAAEDGVFTARFTPPQDAVPDLAITLALEVTAGAAGSRWRLTSGVLYQRRWAELTGRYEDEVRDGSLVVRAEVRVRRAGRYHLQGTLAGPGGSAVGWAQRAAELEPGLRWMDLTFYGLMFHDREADGPYVLRAAALATTERMPHALYAVHRDVHRTAAYDRERFTGQPFRDEHMLAAARRLAPGR